MGACVGVPEGTATLGHGCCSTPLWLACDVQLGLPRGCFQKALHLNAGVGHETVVSCHFVSGKSGCRDAAFFFLFLFFLCLLFSVAVCSERQKGEPTTKTAAALQTQRWFKCRIPNARLVSPLFNFMNSKQRNSNCICKLPGKAKQLEGQGCGGRTRRCRREEKVN